MTVRRDVMESGGRFACLGGHVIGAQNDVAGRLQLETETDHHAAAKAAACAKAAKLIEEDDTIFIDCGTTTPHLAAMIPHEMRADGGLLFAERRRHPEPSPEHAADPARRAVPSCGRLLFGRGGAG